MNLSEFIKTRPTILSIVIIILITLSACPDKYRDVPETLELVSPAGIPGAMAWVDNRLWVQELYSMSVARLSFDPSSKKLELDDYWGRLCLKDPEGLHKNAGGCHAALDLVPSPEGIIAIGPRNNLLIDVEHKGKSKEIIVNESDKNKIIAMTLNGKERYYLEGNEIVRSGVKGRKADVARMRSHHLLNATGLVVHQHKLLTMIRGTGQLLAIGLPPDDFQGAGNKLTTDRLSKPLTAMPYGMAYDAGRRVIWVGSPGLVRILRVSAKVLDGRAENPADSANKPSGAPSKGDIVQNTVWSSDGGLIRVDNTIKIKRGATLEIKPGTKVVFAEDAQLIVAGNLIARGEGERAVELTSESDGVWWGGIRGGKGARLDLKGVKITWARNAVKAVDPAKFVLSDSWVRKTPGDGASIDLASEWPEALKIEGNALDETGGAAVKITLNNSEGPSANVWDISRNTITHASSAIQIGPPSTRPIADRISHKPLRPFAETGALTIDVVGNGIYRNRGNALSISGDELSYPLDVSIGENAILRGNYLGDGVNIYEVARLNFEGNAVADHRSGLNFQNSVVYLRPGIAVTPEVKIVSNFFDHNYIGIIFFNRKGIIKLFRNTFLTLSHSMSPHLAHAGMKFDKSNRNKIMVGNNWERKYEHGLPGPHPFSDEELNKIYGFEGSVFGDVPKSKAVIDCSVLAGPERSPGAGVVVDIRDMKGAPVRKVAGNAYGKLVFSVEPGEYYIKAGKSAQWSRLKAEATSLNRCELSAP